MADDNGPVLNTSAEGGLDAPDTGTDHVVVPVKIEEALAAAAMAAICLISFAFTEEFSVFLLVFMTFVGASAAFAANEHIRISFFLQRMPPKLRWVCEVVTLLATTVMFALIVYYGGKVTWAEWTWGETSPGLGYPAWIYTVWLPLLSAVIILRVLGRGIARLRRRPSRS